MPNDRSEAEVHRLRAENEQLRAALVRYGDRARMAMCPDPSMQQAIDRAFENAK